MLKKKLSKAEFEKLPDDLKAEYTAKGEDYVLQVEGLDDLEQKIKEFRTNNIDLKKQLTAEQKKYEGVDPEKYKEITKQLAALEDKKLIDEGEIEQLLEQRTDRMRKEYEGKIEALTKRNEELESEGAALSESLSTHVIDNEIQRAVTNVGAVMQGAMTDIISRGRQDWKLVEGAPHPQKSDKTTRYGADGKSAETMQEWAEALKDSAPFLFEGSQGAGGGGGGGDLKKGNSKLADLPATERLKEIHRTNQTGS